MKIKLFNIINKQLNTYNFKKPNKLKLVTNTHKIQSGEKLPKFGDHHVSPKRHASTLMDYTDWSEVFIIISVHLTPVTASDSKKEKREILNINTTISSASHKDTSFTEPV